MIRTGRLQHYSSGGLALLVHGLFFAALMFSVSWRNPPTFPVQADLWEALPELPRPAPELEPEPLPAPPPPPPVLEQKPDEAEIALRKAEKKQQELARREEEKRKELERQTELKRQAEAKRQADEQARQEQERREQERLEQERKEKAKRDEARRQVEQEMARQMQSELDAESAQLRAYQERAKAGRQARVINDFKHRIQAKIQSYVRLPQKIAGNPEAVFQVSLLPNGEVGRIILVKSSGQPAYDSEVERAILKASPLPLPGDKEAASVFRDGLTLKFRPLDEAGGGT